ncbi:MAG: YdeI/OmpD-associated family protein [Deltaproteobacteria bacterium]|nr:YdeI/OmpD-associated family protein [Deltaproteobacteria bacterium]
MITVVNEFFAKGCGRCERFDTPACSAKRWAKGLAALRQLCLDAGLEEAAKWGHPCYAHAGRNVVIIGALREDFRLSFFNAGLMKDPEGILEKQGPNTRHSDMIRFTDDDDVAKKKRVISAYLKEAIGYAAKGMKAPKDDRALELPVELEEALASDKELAVAFAALTPGRQKSYVIQLNGAKKSETRVARIGKFRPNILAGKGALDR